MYWIKMAQFPNNDISCLTNICRHSRQSFEDNAKPKHCISATELIREFSFHQLFETFLLLLLLLLIYWHYKRVWFLASSWKFLTNRLQYRMMWVLIRLHNFTIVG
jgi:hypothetical protein